MRYLAEVFPAVQAAFARGTAAHVISQRIGQTWRGMSEDSKRPYVSAYQADVAGRLRERDALLASRPVSGFPSPGSLCAGAEGRPVSLFHFMFE